MCGHGEHDDASYIDPGLKQSELGRDCLVVAEERLRADGWATEAELAAWRGESVRRVEEAVNSVQREPTPDPFQETWCALATPRMKDGFPAEASREQLPASQGSTVPAP